MHSAKKKNLLTANNNILKKNSFPYQQARIRPHSASMKTHNCTAHIHHNIPNKGRYPLSVGPPHSHNWRLLNSPKRIQDTAENIDSTPRIDSNFGNIASTDCTRWPLANLDLPRLQRRPPRPRQLDYLPLPWRLLPRLSRVRSMMG